ncbi:hypothetical protein F444_02805 [Phytophthora nicotianae P1976]|uniref:Uncharacterized protein n=1 Tax=Phytophthora nicotianae P1976 TaxID=1317066 RepID=A0A081AW57_PHYNI|nr:hypothetical protein F444_02805 [Phytophthora nicotianae P1976]
MVDAPVLTAGSQLEYAHKKEVLDRIRQVHDLDETIEHFYRELAHKQLWTIKNRSISELNKPPPFAQLVLLAEELTEIYDTLKTLQSFRKRLKKELYAGSTHCVVTVLPSRG